MKIAIISDPHLGFSLNTRMENDSYENFKEAIERSLDCDLIILGGDIFDSRSPKTKSWSNALKILSLPLLQPTTGVKLVDVDKKLKDVSRITLNHLPVVAIHGNHEMRAKGEENVLEALENAGMLIYLRKNKIIFEKNGVKVAIHGMSYVPERFAKDVLEDWNPKPVDGCFNILILHQNIDPYVYSPLEPPTLDTSNLPKGFDLIIDGHIHVTTKKKIGDTTFLIPGSTISTQLQPSESEVPKGFYKLVIDTDIKTEFIKLERNREFFYVNLKLSEDVPAKEQIEREIRKILFKNFKKEPLIKIRITGKEDVSEQELRYLQRKYSDKAIILFTKSIESIELTEKIEFLRSLKEKKMSIEEIGINILKKNLDELGFKPVFDFIDIFNLLSEGEIDKVLKILIGEQSTLKKFA